MEKINKEMYDHLINAILSLKNEEECASFFEDLCTIKEMQEMSRRYEVARMLFKGKNYVEIAASTGASTATICRVNRCLQYGSEGYSRILERNEEKEKNCDT